MTGRTALLATDGARSYHRLAGEVAEVAAGLPRDRVGPGGVVGVVTRNDAGSVVNVLALVKGGAAPLLLDPSSTDAERRTLLGLAQATGLCVPEPLVTTGDPASDAGPAGDGAATEEPDPTLQCLGEGGAVVLATSGSSGTPRVVRRDWAAMLGNAAGFAHLARYRENDVVFCTTPVFHSYAFCCALLAGMQAGATVALAPVPAPASAVAAVAAETKPTVVLSVPSFYRVLLAGAELGWTASVRLFVAAGEPLDGRLTADWREATGTPLRDHYGTTETGAIALDPGPGAPRPPRLLPGVRARAGGGRDELWVRVPGAPSRYLGASGSEDCWQEGWFRTGDYGKVWASGEVRVDGRLSRRLIVGGRNVDPVEVEHAVEAVAGVRRCVLVQEQRPPERIIAFVASDTSYTELALRMELAKRLSAYKIPARLIMVPEIPTTPSGKVRLAALWAAVPASDRGAP